MVIFFYFLVVSIVPFKEESSSIVPLIRFHRKFLIIEVFDLVDF